MMSENVAGFLETIDGEADFVERFVRILENERARLIEGRTEALAAIVEEKEILAARLNELTQRRNRYLLEHGFTSDTRGMEAWLARHPEYGDALAVWQRTLSLAAQAKELNHLNEQLIRTHIQHIRQALEILLRKENPLNLYGSDGRSTALGDQQINDSV
jgi:flagellar biosynthesis/type III secretory pathway chaperone